MKKILGLFMKNAFVVLLFCTLCSCQGNKNSQFLIDTHPTIGITMVEDKIPSWNLKAQSENSTVFFENQVDSIVLIPLESNENVIIGSISHIEIVEDKLLVADMYKAQQIFLFDMQGNYLHTIGNKGEGPDEYTSINQLTVSPDGICILDWMKWKLLCFGIDGKLRYRHQFKKGIPEMVFRWDEHLFIGSHAGYTHKNPYHLTWINEMDSLLNTGLPIMNVHPAPAGKLKYSNDGSILFYHSLCDTVYQITDKQIIPKWRLGLYEPEEISTFLKKTKNMSQKEYMQLLYNFKSDNIVNYFDLHEGKNHWVVDYQQGSYAYISVIDKNGGSLHRYVKADINTRECYVPFVFTSISDDWMCSFLDQSFYTQMDQLMQERFLCNIKSEEQRNMIRNYDIENKNPIICLFHLK